jgi:hypothetical protein
MLRNWRRETIVRVAAMTGKTLLCVGSVTLYARPRHHSVMELPSRADCLFVACLKARCFAGYFMTMSKVLLVASERTVRN